MPWCNVQVRSSISFPFPPPAAPSTASTITLHGIRLLLHHVSVIPTLPSAPPVIGIAAVSPCNLVDSTKSETAATTSSCVDGAVGPIIPNDDHGIVDVPANLAGTNNPGTPTSPLLAPVAAQRNHDVGASDDRHAGVHDGVNASRNWNAWKPAPRLVLGETIDRKMDETGMTLRRHWSDPQTSDSSGNVSRVGAVARGLPPGRDTRAAGKGRYEQLAECCASMAAMACDAERGANAGAPGKKGNGQAG